MHIEKFRWFSDVECEVWSHITVIAWQNWTQKTTILWLISQPFSISNTENPMHNEKPLSWWNFKSAFSEKFRLSDEFDKPWSHEWTLYFRWEWIQPFTVESILRDQASRKIRFWKKGSRSAWSWYMQYPVIYLSLKRLYPIWEDWDLYENNDTDFLLTDEENSLYQRWYKKILLLPRENILSINHLSSKIKQTVWINTDNYDWKSNSAWQDNLWKILLAIISLKRLKENYPNDYKWWILAIDELDAALYPASQVKLLELLHDVSQQYKIQVFFTTHSLSLLERASQFRKQHDVEKEKVKIIFLEKKDNIVTINERSLDYIKNNLEVSLWNVPAEEKIDIYCEDEEAILFVRCILWKAITNHVNFVKVNLGCGEYRSLLEHKVPSFIWPNSIIILDWDARSRKDWKFKNLLFLPKNSSPERIIAKFLKELPDSDSFWKTIHENFSCQLCFSEYLYEDIEDDRNKAKEWRKSSIIKPYLNKIIKYWKKENNFDVVWFRLNFVSIYNSIAQEKWYSTLL